MNPKMDIGFIRIAFFYFKSATVIASINSGNSGVVLPDTWLPSKETAQFALNSPPKDGSPEKSSDLKKDAITLDKDGISGLNLFCKAIMFYLYFVKRKRGELCE